MDAEKFQGLFYTSRKMGKDECLKKDAMLESFNDDDHENEFLKGKKVKSVAFVGGSGRKGSNGRGGSGIRCCQVEKCNADLTDAKPYHRRHKVCQLHAKAQVVLVGGIRQRFCQQCSRFHELEEFDDAKRSCRRRLTGHNERRRKTSGERNTSSDNGSSRKARTDTKGLDHGCGGIQMAIQ